MPDKSVNQSNSGTGTPFTAAGLNSTSTKGVGKSEPKVTSVTLKIESGGRATVTGVTVKTGK